MYSTLYDHIDTIVYTHPFIPVSLISSFTVSTNRPNPAKLNPDSKIPTTTHYMLERRVFEN